MAARTLNDTDKAYGWFWRKVRDLNTDKKAAVKLKQIRLRKIREKAKRRFISFEKIEADEANEYKVDRVNTWTKKEVKYGKRMTFSGYTSSDDVRLPKHG